MPRSVQWKLLLVAASVVASIVALWPTFFFYQRPREERLQAPEGTETARLRDKAIPLGLDLQGGMHLVLEVDRSKLPPEEAEGAVDRAMEIIRNRVDQFGVAEPLIQKQGDDRIVVQLPGLSDRNRAKELIGQTALLEFKLVRSADEAGQIINRLDNYLGARAAGRAPPAAPPADTMSRADTSAQARAQALADSLARAALGDTASGPRPLSSLFLTGGGGGAFVASADVPKVQALLTPQVLESVVPRDSQLLWSSEEGFQGRTGRWLYVVKRTPEISGGSVATATAALGLDPSNPSGWGVSLKLSGRGPAEFARVTAANVGRQLAIVLDNTVRSAPSINERIPGGNAQITGSFTDEEAKDLMIVLQAGSLPAPVTIIEERSVGPSLGQDSIEAGFKAAWIGTLLVIAFTVFYYRGSGLVAIAALILNVLLLFAGLAGLGATLTLPGIAGVVLTIGMAIDANVLIFERIREELRHGKTVRTAIELGYDRAFRTILDANVTTLISAAFLFQFGTGPIKGFAVTLSIGLIANMFTAVFFTRMVYDMITHRRTLRTLSI